MDPKKIYEKMLYGTPDEQSSDAKKASSLAQDANKTRNVLENAIIDEIVNMVMSPGYKPDIRGLESIRDKIKEGLKGWHAFSGEFSGRFGREIIPRIVEKIRGRRNISDLEERIAEAWSIIAKDLLLMNTEKAASRIKSEKIGQMRENMSERDRMVHEIVGRIVEQISSHYKKAGDIKFTRYIQEIDAKLGIVSSLPGATERDSRGKLKAVLREIKEKVLKEIREKIEKSEQMKRNRKVYETALNEFTDAIDVFLDSLNKGIVSR